MKVIWPDERKNIRFDKLCVGEVFSTNTEKISLWMKIEPAKYQNQSKNCVLISAIHEGGTRLGFVASDTIVTQVDCEIHVVGKD